MLNHQLARSSCLPMAKLTSIVLLLILAHEPLLRAEEDQVAKASSGARATARAGDSTTSTSISRARKCSSAPAPAVSTSSMLATAASQIPKASPSSTEDEPGDPLDHNLAEKCARRDFSADSGPNIDLVPYGRNTAGTELRRRPSRSSVQ